MNDDGTFKGIKVIPTKAVFIGNSLLRGWSTFGMAATDNTHDYFYHVSQRIKVLNPEVKIISVSNGNLEHSTTNSDFETGWNIIKPYLTNDTDLICIQLGDNVNTVEKNKPVRAIQFLYYD